MATLKEACSNSKAFKLFIWYSMVAPLNFKVTLNGQDLKIKPYTSDRYMCQPYVKTVLELKRYSDSSNIPPLNRYNQLLNVLDFTWHEDAELLRSMIVDGNHLPDKINLKVLLTAFPELGN